MNQNLACFGGTVAREPKPRATVAHGTGTGIQDVWRPEEHQSEARSVDDPRRRETVCRKCNQKVVLMELQGRWYTRNEDGLPHALTCEAEP